MFYIYAYTITRIKDIKQKYTNENIMQLENMKFKNIKAQSASLRSLVAAESKAAEIEAAVGCFESVCQLYRICLDCACEHVNCRLE